MHAARVRGPRDLQENGHVNVHRLQQAHEIHGTCVRACVCMRVFAGKRRREKGRETVLERDARIRNRIK